MTDKDRDEEVLADLIQKWEDLRDMGQNTPPEVLCAEHPHLLPELKRRIEILGVTSWLDEPLPAAGADDPQPSPTSDPLLSRVLGGRYRIEKLVARGGFAQVYQGYDTELQRSVAIKIPKPSRLLSADSFMAEARRVARLKHPNIVQVYDVGREGDICFIVSEFIEGGSLADHLTNSPPSSQQALRWICDVADALEHAHLHGVVHRDVKPGNILIDAHNRALLADFGIAKSANRAGQEVLSLGTLRYMSPEAVEGKESDHRSDIYSLGVVLHEALTGNVPYSSLQLNILKSEIVRGAKSSPKIGEDVRRICEKSLQRDPSKRHSSAAQVAAEIRHALRASDKALSGLRWRRQGLMIGAALVGVLGLGVFLSPDLPKRLRPALQRPTAQREAGPITFSGRFIETPIERFAPCSLEAWINPVTIPSTDVFLFGSDVRGFHGIGLCMHGPQLAVEYLTGFECSDAIVPEREWTHVAAVFGAEETRLYMNGKLVLTANATRAEGGTPFVIGRIGSTNPDFVFVGEMKGVRISKGERYRDDFVPTPAESLQSDDATLALYDGKQDGDRVIDASLNENDGAWR